MKAFVATGDGLSRPALDGWVAGLEEHGLHVEPLRHDHRLLRHIIVTTRESSAGAPRWTINPQPAVRAASSSESWALALSLHGIPVAQEALPAGAVRRLTSLPQGECRLVKVHVGDLNVLAVEDEGDGALTPEHRSYQKIMDAACRAVYLLGLHFGCVHVRVHPQGGWYIAAVDPAPDVDTPLGRAYGRAVGRLLLEYEASRHAPREVTLGADPEFALATPGGRLVDISRYVEKSGEVGYDRQTQRRGSPVHPIAELRPRPSPSPLALAVNVERALERATQLLPTRRTKWIAGSYPLGLIPTGGHIHFSGTRLTTPLLFALDQCLAIPLMLLERRTPAKRRRRRYGRLGDFRRKEHGGFEYRTLSSWLVEPAATRATLSLAKVIATEWPTLCDTMWPGARVSREFYLSKKARFRRAFPDFWAKLIASPTAQAYAYELHYIAHMVAGGKEWNEEQDFKIAW